MAENEEDEISLIDLFAVLLRWRFWIGGLTAAAGAIAAVVFFVFPLVGIGPKIPYTIRMRVEITQLPPVLRSEMSVNPAALVRSFALESQTVAEAYIKHGLGENGKAPEIGDPVFRAFVVKEFIDKLYKVSLAGDFVNFELSAENSESAERFLRDMIETSERKARRTVVDKSALVADTMALLYRDAPAGTIIAETAKQLIISSAIYKSGETPVSRISGDVEVLREPQGRAMKALLATLAGLFGSILLSFMLEAVANIKKDPEAMAKIAAALADKPSIKNILKLK